MIPKILYHGTSRARWETGIKAQGLKGNMPRVISTDNRHLGYVFFAESVNVAAFYGLQTVVMDNNVNKVYKELNRILQDSAIVLIVHTKDLPGVELDPEKNNSTAWLTANGVTVEKMRKYGILGYDLPWWRYKGDIPKNKVLPYVDVSYNNQSPEMMETLETVTAVHLLEFFK
jgi:hypothetical protein